MSHPFTRAENLSSNNSFQTTVHLQQKAWFGLTIKNMLLLFLPALLFFSKGISQTTTTFPAATSCTSKDLILTGATLPGTDLCNTCTTGDSVHRTLKLSINNKTGSTRTSFAFWGT